MQFTYLLVGVFLGVGGGYFKRQQETGDCGFFYVLRKSVQVNPGVDSGGRLPHFLLHPLQFVIVSPCVFSCCGR
jgi:hypothetical protein